MDPTTCVREAYQPVFSPHLGPFWGGQWLGHYKTLRLGRGALYERYLRRQTEARRLGILAPSSLPFRSSSSSGYFSLSQQTLQHTVSSVIQATTAFGLVFYSFTVVSLLKSPNCPFQTPVSTVFQHVLRNVAFFPTMVRKNWKGHLYTRDDLLGGLLWFSRYAFYSAKDLIVMFLSQIPFSLRRKVGPLANVPEPV